MINRRILEGAALAASFLMIAWVAFGDNRAMEKCLEKYSRAVCINQLWR